MFKDVTKYEAVCLAVVENCISKYAWTSDRGRLGEDSAMAYNFLMTSVFMY